MPSQRIFSYDTKKILGKKNFSASNGPVFSIFTWSIVAIFTNERLCHYSTKVNKNNNNNNMNNKFVNFPRKNDLGF